DHTHHGRLRQPDHHPAEPDQGQAGARPDRLRDAVADHVRAAVPLRLRQRHPGARRPQLRGVPAAGHLRPDGRLREHHHRRQPGGGPAEGAHRPLPVAADGAFGGAGRAHCRRPDAQRPHDRRHDDHRAAGGLADPHLHRRGDPRGAAPAHLRLRDVLGDGAGRAAGTDAGGREQRELHRDLPDHLHREHVRADRQLPVGAQDLRGVEPGVRGGPGRAGAVRQRRAGHPRAGELGAAEPGALRVHLGGGLPGHLRAAVGPHLPPDRQSL
ncbi:MAG: Efflux ABC transporter, permease protein, partial [uncultured Blastococcus sp.]